MVSDGHIYENEEPHDHIYGNREPTDHIYGNQEPLGRPLNVTELESYISEISGREEGFAEEFSVSYQKISLSVDTALHSCTKQTYMPQKVVKSVIYVAIHPIIQTNLLNV